MRLEEVECWARLTAATHGVLATLHDRRGVDAVPVVFAVIDHTIIVPVDTVKPKQHTRLQRLLNVERDPRCALLIDEYDDDWSQLWWVRVHCSATIAEPTGDVLAALARRYTDYAAPGSVTTTLVLTPTEVTGWTA